jgi:hypothetical protein
MEAFNEWKVIWALEYGMHMGNYFFPEGGRSLP